MCFAQPDSDRIHSWSKKIKPIEPGVTNYVCDALPGATRSPIGTFLKVARCVRVVASRYTTSRRTQFGPSVEHSNDQKTVLRG